MTKEIKGELKQFGFDPSKIIIEDDQWQLGSIAQQVVNANGDWSKFLPIYEPQSNGSFDSFGCTCFGSLNQIEILLNFLEGKEYNFAERYPYNIVGIEPPGANPHLVYQAIRHDGLLTQEDLPFSQTLAEFKSPRPMTEELLAKGREWLKDYTLEHEWINAPSGDDVASMLRFSPIALSVTAWFEQNGLYVDNGQANTHWCVCFRAEKVPEGYILYIFDSYDHSIKKLAPEHKISFAKRISIKKKEENKPVKKSWKIWLKELLTNLFAWDF